MVSFSSTRLRGAATRVPPIVFLFAFHILLQLAALASAPSPAEAQQMFMGVVVTPASGTYVILQDINVRAEPATKSNKVANLKTGDRVEAAGRVTGGWVAVRKGDNDIGFVYAPSMMPLIDGVLTEDIRANIAIEKDIKCNYTVRFEGKNAIEGEDYDIADYEVAYVCQVGAKKVEFLASMYMSEASYQLSQNAVFQINIDVLDMNRSFDNVFSTVLLYDREKEHVVLDSISIEDYRGTPGTKEKPAKTVAEALRVAVELALGAWSRKAWTGLAEPRR
ncbi:MAG: SH3 domain-containing protein [Rhodospirillales bacterium]|nr:SH3 domain-containing protein [Rhodospirillales bacterium]